MSAIDRAVVIPPDDRTIVERLIDVQAQVRAVAKGEHNAAQRFNFRGIDAVVNAVGPALRRHGVLVAPHVEHVEYLERTSSAGARMAVVHLTVRYRFTAPDGSTHDAVVPAESWDTGDKGTAKAMSVAMRTALLQALCLPTDEPDPDHDVYQLAAEQPPTVRPAVQRAAAAVGALGVDVPTFVARALGRPLAGWHELGDADAETLMHAVDEHTPTTPTPAPTPAGDEDDA